MLVDTDGILGRHNPWPTPFPTANSDNPTTGSVPATEGTATDDHDLEGKLDTDFRQPYFANSFVADQTINYSCIYGGGTITGTFYGPAAITRSVSQNADGSWTFTVSEPVDGGLLWESIDPLP
jgi:hypothetical protein